MQEEIFDKFWPSLWLRCSSVNQSVQPSHLTEKPRCRANTKTRRSVNMNQYNANTIELLCNGHDGAHRLSSAAASAV
jgi:hypothetical protein